MINLRRLHTNIPILIQHIPLSTNTTSNRTRIRDTIINRRVHLSTLTLNISIIPFITLLTGRSVSIHNTAGYRLGRVGSALSVLGHEEVRLAELAGVVIEHERAALEVRPDAGRLGENVVALGVADGAFVGCAAFQAPGAAGEDLGW